MGSSTRVRSPPACDPNRPVFMSARCCWLACLLACHLTGTHHYRSVPTDQDLKREDAVGLATRTLRPGHLTPRRVCGALRPSFAGLVSGVDDGRRRRHRLRPLRLSATCHSKRLGGGCRGHGRTARDVSILAAGVARSSEQAALPPARSCERRAPSGAAPARSLRRATPPSAPDSASAPAGRPPGSAPRWNRSTIPRTAPRPATRCPRRRRPPWPRLESRSGVGLGSGRGGAGALAAGGRISASRAVDIVP